MAKNDNDSDNNYTGDKNAGASWPQNAGNYSDGDDSDNAGDDGDDASDWVRASVADTLAKATDLLKRGLVTPSQFDNLVAELGRILDGVPADDGDDDDDDGSDSSDAYGDNQNYGSHQNNYRSDGDDNDDDKVPYAKSR